MAFASRPHADTTFHSVLRCCRPFVGLAILAFISPVTGASAQAVYGSISGTITDASGGAVPGATVTITSVDRKTSNTVVANESGVYVKERLLPGRYEVKAELSGFKTAVFPDVNVSVDTQTRLDVKLELGQVAESVTVAGFSPVLKTDRADVASTFDTHQINDLPLLDRNFTKLILSTPGTQQLQWQHAASENPQGSVQTMVNGQHFSGTGYQLDGTENRDPILGIIVINPNFDAIQEAKITSQNYDAEFGQATAGVVSVQTKSGTNNFHGSGFEFYLSDALQARNPFSQAVADDTGRFIPETKRNQFGGSIGGPITRDRFFFFGDYQGWRSTTGGSQLLTVPTDAARRGDLSAYGVNIYDPAGGPPSQRQQFANNIIPSGRLSPQALAILDLIPRANRPGTESGTRNNFVGSGSEIFDNDTFDVRIDGRINDRLNAFGRYSMGDYRRDGPTALGRGGGTAIVSLGGSSKVNNQSIAGGFDRSIGNNMTADFRFGFFRYKVSVLPFDFGTTPAADAGIPGLNLDNTWTSGLFGGFVDGDRGFNFGSGLGVNRCNCPLDENEKQAQFVGNLTRMMGPHTVKFGADIRRAWNLRVPSDRHRSGELTFNVDRTRGPEGGGLALATFLLGDVTRFTRYASPTTDAAERQWRQFYYVQDTWRPMPKVTLNYGLRLDVIHPQTVNGERKGGWLLGTVNGGQVDLPSPYILVGGVGGVPLNGGVKNSLNWAPRVGATYQINEKTVLRGGYGRSYDIGVFGSLFGHSVTQNLPVFSVQETTAPNNFDAVFNLSRGPDPPDFGVVSSNGQLLVPRGVFQRALPDKQRPPTVDAYNVTVQRELTQQISVEVGYVGNHGVRVFVGDGPAVNANQPTLQGFPTVSQDARKPFFQRYGWTQGIDFFCNCGTNRYDSLQTKLTKRFANGYSIFAQYTAQRQRNHDGGQFFYLPDLEYGPALWDRAHSFTVATTYELPLWKENRWLRGWQINQSTTIQSGLPFDVTYKDAGADRDTGPNRPDLVGDAMAGGGTRDRWFNATPIGSAGSAFARPAVGTFGNLARNSLGGPAYWRVDVSLFKRFELRTNQSLELRVESVNFFNHVNLGQPDSEIGVPGNDNVNAGRITKTAYDGSDSQRNFQFALKYIW
jgi:Carboxypeptidase regulatory-like domain/TonB dependent receptor-like, beta-barrel